MNIQYDIESLVQQYREPQPPALPPNVERELFDIIAGLEQKASQEAIRSGRQWLELNEMHAMSIASLMRKRIDNCRPIRTACTCSSSSTIFSSRSR